MPLPYVCARCWPQLAKLLKARGEGDVVVVTGSIGLPVAPVIVDRLAWRECPRRASIPNTDEIRFAGAVALTRRKCVCLSRVAGGGTVAPFARAAAS